MRMLRFRKNDGTDYPEWNETLFSNTFDFLSNNTLSRDCLNYDGGDVKNIHYGDVLIKFGAIKDVQDEDVPYINSDVPVKKYVYLQDGDVVIADTAEDTTCGKAVELCGVGSNKVVSGLHTIACRPKLDYTKGFLGYYLNSESYRTQLYRTMQGTKVTSINRGALEKTVLKTPSDLDEQQKIADCLSSVDSVIADYESQIGNMQNQKKSVMQKLFSQEVRFKKDDGSDYPEWNYSAIDEFTSVFSASRVHKEEWQSDGVPFWRSSDVMAFHQKRKNNMGEAYISKELYEKLSAKSGKIMKDDILITGGGSIGMPYIVPIDDAMYVKDADLLCIRKSNTHNSAYLFHYFMSEGFRRYLTEINHKGSIAHYTITQVNNTIVPLPHPDEQKKIADCLSAFDDAIDDLQKTVEHWKNIKKGLLQQLFV